MPISPMPCAPIGACGSGMSVQVTSISGTSICTGTWYSARLGPLDIATIAAAASMSPSTLHNTFRAVTNVSPLQYLKQLRLHQARLLMLHHGLGAGEAAHRVGYGSD